MIAIPLAKKIAESGIDVAYTPWEVDAINSAWEGTTLVTMYMDAGWVPSDKALKFITDRMTEYDVLRQLMRPEKRFPKHDK